MKHISTYQMGIHGLSSRILNAMEMDSIQLKQIRLEELILVLIEPEQLLPVYQKIVSCTSISCVESLEIYCQYAREPIALYPFKIYTRLSNLTHLTIHPVYDIYLLAHVLLNLPSTIQILDFESLCISGNDEEEKINALDNIRPCGLKTLNLMVTVSTSSNVVHNINRALSLVLRACPLLEQFKLYGSLILKEEEANILTGVLNLNFLCHARIKHIAINIDGCNYYTFNEEGKRWRSHNDNLVVEGSVSKDESWHIHLEWNGRVKLQLVDYLKVRG